MARRRDGPLHHWGDFRLIGARGGGTPDKVGLARVRLVLPPGAVGVDGARFLDAVRGDSWLLLVQPVGVAVAYDWLLPVVPCRFPLELLKAPVLLECQHVPELVVLLLPLR